MSSKNKSLNKEIVYEFIKRGYFKSSGAVQNFISKIKTDEGLNCTQNAAAQVAAKIKGFSVARRLKKEDVVPASISQIVDKYLDKKSRYKNLQKKDPTNFKSKITKSQDPIEKEAWSNTVAYPSIYVLENKLRLLLLTQMGNNQNWWKKPEVPEKIQDYAFKIKEDEKDTPWIPARGEHPLYYITLKHISKIIQINWSKFNKLGKQSKFLATLEDLATIRNCLAHNSKLTSRDKSEVKIQVPKILSVLKQNYNI
jgi:hypothetical protein